MNQEIMNQAMQQMNLCEQEIGKAIIGQKEVIRQSLIALLVDGNVLLEGVPGLGKTQLVKAISNILHLDFKRIQFTPDLMPADVTGTNLILTENGTNHFQFEKGPVFTNLLLADEINRATPKTQSALLEAMQEKTVTVGKSTYQLDPPYMVFATQNPIENEGTYPLPEAQLDRFLFKIKVDFPSLEELKEIVELTISQNKEQSLKEVLNGEELLKLRALVAQIPIAQSVFMYGIRLIAATQKESKEATKAAQKYIVNGASPRAAQAIIKAAKANAFLDGRLNVSFEDLRQMAYPVLRHRLGLSFETMTEQITVEEVINQIIKEVPID